tara:strand:- start:10320 stop:12110 length:1791 start_codon:yes stop_codon:yes gene_type:complete
MAIGDFVKGFAGTVESGARKALAGGGSDSKSKRQPPSWVNNPPKGFKVVSAASKDLQASRGKAGLDAKGMGVGQREISEAESWVSALDDGRYMTYILVPDKAADTGTKKGLEDEVTSAMEPRFTRERPSDPVSEAPEEEPDLSADVPGEDIEAMLADIEDLKPEELKDIVRDIARDEMDTASADATAVALGDTTGERMGVSTGGRFPEGEQDALAQSIASRTADSTQLMREAAEAPRTPADTSVDFQQFQTPAYQPPGTPSPTPINQLPASSGVPLVSQNPPPGQGFVGPQLASGGVPRVSQNPLAQNMMTPTGPAQTGGADQGFVGPTQAPQFPTSPLTDIQSQADAGLAPPQFPTSPLTNIQTEEEARQANLDKMRDVYRQRPQAPQAPLDQAVTEAMEPRQASMADRNAAADAMTSQIAGAMAPMHEFNRTGGYGMNWPRQSGTLGQTPEAPRPKGPVSGTGLPSEAGTDLEAQEAAARAALAGTGGGESMGTASGGTQQSLDRKPAREERDAEGGGRGEKARGIMDKIRNFVDRGANTPAAKFSSDPRRRTKEQQAELEAWIDAGRPNDWPEDWNPRKPLGRRPKLENTGAY